MEICLYGYVLIFHLKFCFDFRLSLCLRIMFTDYVYGLCLRIMFTGYVYGLCLRIMFTGYVYGLCLRIMFIDYVYGLVDTKQTNCDYLIHYDI